MPWLLLVVAGILEIGWAVGLKYTKGFTELWPTIGTLAAMIASISLLGIAMRSLPVGTSYAVWTGIGACRDRRVGYSSFWRVRGNRTAGVRCAHTGRYCRA